MGYALHFSAMNQPFGFPGEFESNSTNNPANLTMEEFFEEKVDEEGIQPFIMFETLFFALFGITGYINAQNTWNTWTYN